MPRRARRTSRRDSPQIDKLIHVFISSSQTEFSSLRKKLKARIDILRVEDSKRIFIADLVEKHHGESIQSDINESLALASIYVAIIGDKNSKWTMEEFEEAWLRGVPVLLIDYRKRKGAKTPISRWFARMKKRGIRVEDTETPYRDDDDVVSHVLGCLPDKLGDIASKYQQVRNIVARKGTFGVPRI